MRRNCPPRPQNNTCNPQRYQQQQPPVCVIKQFDPCAKRNERRFCDDFPEVNLLPYYCKSKESTRKISSGAVGLSPSVGKDLGAARSFNNNKKVKKKAPVAKKPLKKIAEKPLKPAEASKEQVDLVVTGCKCPLNERTSQSSKKSNIEGIKSISETGLIVKDEEVVEEPDATIEEVIQEEVINEEVIQEEVINEEVIQSQITATSSHASSYQSHISEECSIVTGSFIQQMRAEVKSSKISSHSTTTETRVESKMTAKSSNKSIASKTMSVRSEDHNEALKASLELEYAEVLKEEIMVNKAMLLEDSRTEVNQLREEIQNYRANAGVPCVCPAALKTSTMGTSTIASEPRSAPSTARTEHAGVAAQVETLWITDEVITSSGSGTPGEMPDLNFESKLTEANNLIDQVKLALLDIKKGMASAKTTPLDARSVKDGLSARAESDVTTPATPKIQPNESVEKDEDDNGDDDDDSSTVTSDEQETDSTTATSTSSSGEDEAKEEEVVKLDKVVDEDPCKCRATRGPTSPKSKQDNQSVSSKSKDSEKKSNISDNSKKELEITAEIIELDEHRDFPPVFPRETESMRMLQEKLNTIEEASEIDISRDVVISTCGLGRPIQIYQSNCAQTPMKIVLMERACSPLQVLASSNVERAPEEPEPERAEDNQYVNFLLRDDSPPLDLTTGKSFHHVNGDTSWREQPTSDTNKVQPTRLSVESPKVHQIRRPSGGSRQSSLRVQRLPPINIRSGLTTQKTIQIDIKPSGVSVVAVMKPNIGYREFRRSSSQNLSIPRGEQQNEYVRKSSQTTTVTVGSTSSKSPDSGTHSEKNVVERIMKTYEVTSAPDDTICPEDMKLVFNSYQVFRGKDHEPQMCGSESVGTASIATVNPEVYKTFINPNGLKNARTALQSNETDGNTTTGSTGSKQSVMSPRQVVPPVKTKRPSKEIAKPIRANPFAIGFYSSKAIQCEIVSKSKLKIIDTSVGSQAKVANKPQRRQSQPLERAEDEPVKDRSDSIDSQSSSEVTIPRFRLPEHIISNIMAKAHTDKTSSQTLQTLKDMVAEKRRRKSGESALDSSRTSRELTDEELLRLRVALTSAKIGTSGEDYSGLVNPSVSSPPVDYSVMNEMTQVSLSNSSESQDSYNEDPRQSIVSENSVANKFITGLTDLSPKDISHYRSSHHFVDPSRRKSRKSSSFRKSTSDSPTGESLEDDKILKIPQNEKRKSDTTTVMTIITDVRPRLSEGGSTRLDSPKTCKRSYPGSRRCEVKSSRSATPESAISRSPPHSRKCETICGPPSASPDNSFSEGEVKCKCNTSLSMGEVHSCKPSRSSGARNIKYLKKHPEIVVRRELGESMEITRERAFYDNWIAYYVQRNNQFRNVNDSSSSNSPNF